MPSVLEQTYQDAIVRAANAPHSGMRLWRKNVLQARVCSCGTKAFFRSGAAEGGADLDGIVSPEGWRLEVEVKSSTARLTVKQKQWTAAIVRMGGIAVIVRYREDLDLEANVGAAIAVIAHDIAARRAWEAHR